MNKFIMWAILVFFFSYIAIGIFSFLFGIQVHSIMIYSFIAICVTGLVFALVEDNK